MSDICRKLEEYAGSKKTMSILSLDKNANECMTSSDISAYDFDYIKQQYTKKIHKGESGIHSSDCLWVVDEDRCIVFIEFKNGKTFKKNDILFKMKDSLLIYCDVIGKGISETRKNVEYVVVYNKDKRPIQEQEDTYKNNYYLPDSRSRSLIKVFFLKKAKKELIRWGLEKYVGIYFKAVHTYNQDEFEDYISSMAINT